MNGNEQKRNQLSFNLCCEIRLGSKEYAINERMENLELNQKG